MKKTISAVLFLCIVITLLLQSAGLAWMSDNGMSSPIHITSNVHKQYFEGGTGTKEDPYQIASPIQLYYFAWLQYLGYFNTEDKDDNDEIDTFYFVLNNDIDMHEVNSDGELIEYILPPIGTTDNPFIGNFDGCGYTVKNATVENLYSSLIEPPEQTTEENFEGVEIIGFFGVVGEIKGEHKYDYASSANEVKNLVLENLTVKTQTKKSLIGLVAGYVNGIVDCVGIMGGTVNIVNGVEALSFTANISDYSLIGYCEDPYKDSVYVMDVVLSKPGTTDKYNVVPSIGGEGDTNGWGGSIAMTSIYTWLSAIRDGIRSNINFIIRRTDFVKLNGKHQTLGTPETASKKATVIEGFGSFIYTTLSSDYNFMSGATEVTEYRLDYTEKDVTVYYITDGTNYLCFNGSSITNTTNSANATKWYASNGTNGGSVYTVVNGSVYYLTLNNGTIATIEDYTADRSNLPSWNISNGCLAFDDSQIGCNNGNWQLAVTAGVIVGHYKMSLRNSNTYLDNKDDLTGVQSVTNASNAAVWTIAEVSGGYTLSTVVNGTRYYVGYSSLNTSGQTTLTLSTTAPTIWQYSNNQIYVRSGSNTFYLRYSNSGGNFLVQSYTSSNSFTLTEAEGSDVGLESNETEKVTITSTGTTEKEIVYSETVFIDNSLENYTYNANGDKVINNQAGITYFPLTADTSDGSYKPSKNNTGYIVSAEWGAIETREHDTYGNVRISRYNRESNLGNYQRPYTISYKTNVFKTIPQTPTASQLKSLGLNKYGDCYGDFRLDMQADNYCYGLHFMTAAVTMSNITEITASLNGKTIPNYQVPTNCIDFNLYERGFVNCFAGSYYTQYDGNDAFFSLYEITRDEETGTKITDIKEIYKVYGRLVGDVEGGDIDTRYEYVYTYKGLKEGGEAGKISDYVEIGKENVPDNYFEVFNCLWIIHPDEDGRDSGQGVYDFYDESNSDGPANWEIQKAFYFEVPLNDGEYALGSSTGRTGAYLVYLDLAANAQLIERTKDEEMIVEEKTETTTPKGVELLAPGETSSTVDPSDSAFVSINTKGDGTTAASGDISYSTADGITITHSATSGTSAEYIGVNNVLQDGGGNPMALQGVIKTIERTTYRDSNLTTGETIITVITKTTEKDGNTETTTYKRQITKTNVEGELIETIEDEGTEPTTPDTDTSPTTSPGEELIRLYFAYGHTENVTETGETTIKENVTIEYLYVPAEKDAQGNATTAPSYEITVTNSGTETVKLKAVLLQTGSGITFYVNGTALQDTTTAQTVEIAPSGSNSDPTP